MTSWPKMQFRFYGISKWTGKLVGDATEIDNLAKWAKSRGIDGSGLHPFGLRPIPPVIEDNYPHSPCYVTQKDANNFFA